MNTKPLLLQALTWEKITRPPVWCMRQAGRFLPEYRELRDKYDFFTRVQTPELATAITLQPVDIFGVDAAILFSDILVVPQAMGLTVELVENKWPFLPNTIRTKEDVEKLSSNAADNLGYVYDAVQMIKWELGKRVNPPNPLSQGGIQTNQPTNPLSHYPTIPLIWFAGAPFTLLCYMVEGKGSKTFDKAKKFCLTEPVLAHALLEKITNVTIAYLKNQVTAGVDVIQVFDSWSGLLSPEDFRLFALPYLTRIADELAELAPVILFPKGSNYALEELSQTRASGIGIDWTITPEEARKLTGGNITLQWNFDPSHLYLSPEQIEREVHEMIRRFGTQNYIANLGHGMLPDIPVEHAKAFVNAVKSYRA